MGNIGSPTASENEVARDALEIVGFTDAGDDVHLQWVIYFPWVPEDGELRGELIYSTTPF